MGSLPHRLGPHVRKTRAKGLDSGLTNNSIGIPAIAWNVKVSSTSHSYDNHNAYVLNDFQSIIYRAENQFPLRRSS